MRYLTLIITLVSSTVLVESTSSILELVFWVTIRRERDFNDLAFYVCGLHMQVIELSTLQGLLLPVQSYWIFPSHLGSECLQHLSVKKYLLHCRWELVPIEFSEPSRNNRNPLWDEYLSTSLRRRIIQQRERERENTCTKDWLNWLA